MNSDSSPPSRLALSNQKADPARYRVGTLSYTRPALVMLFFWLLWGDFCYMLMENVVPSIMPLKFQSLQASNMLVGMILGTIPNSITVMLNPIISFKSDRYRSRLGRRIPFILFTIPPLVTCLIGLAFSDQIARWLQVHVAHFAGALSATEFSLLIISVIMILFSFFNTFVNSVFWYLFNDVVPEHLLARFMSWFRVVSMASVSFYNFFVFRFAGTHATEIMVGAAVLYFFGFGLMCFFVREGRYPPPEPYENGQTGAVAAIKTYARECHGLLHYWHVFLIAICAGAVTASTTFTLFFYQSTGLTLEMIGTVTGVGNIAMAVLIIGSGWLADRYHPIRVVVGGIIMQVLLVMPASLFWLFWSPSPQASFYLWLGMTVGLVAPAGALIGVLDPPMLMRVFPRDRYGQFCSANALWRSASMIVSGLLVGIYLDVLSRFFGKDIAYRSLPVWQMGCYVLMLFSAWQLYRSWKRYGGDEAYVAPLPTAKGNLQTVGVAGAIANGQT